MVKTRSQTGDLTIKKEEEEDRKPTLLLNGVSSTTRNRIVKRKSSKNSNRTLPAQQVKVEEDTDTKSLLQPTPKLPKGQRVSQDQKNELINYIANDKMNITAASKRAKMGFMAGYAYYHKYFNEQNPDIGIPSHINPRTTCTQEQIKEIISYIVDDKMSIKAVSRKANMSLKLLKNIPVSKYRNYVTRDRIDELVGYIVGDKMSIAAASEKANMDYNTGNKYYRQYLKKHNTVPPISRWISQDKIKEFIGYIIDDKMSINVASRKAKIPYSTGYEHYQKYLKNQNHDALTSCLRINTVHKN